MLNFARQQALLPHLFSCPPTQRNNFYLLCCVMENTHSKNNRANPSFYCRSFMWKPRSVCCWDIGQAHHQLQLPTTRTVVWFVHSFFFWNSLGWINWKYWAIYSRIYSNITRLDRNRPFMNKITFQQKEGEILTALMWKRSGFRFTSHISSHYSFGVVIDHLTRCCTSWKNLHNAGKCFRRGQRNVFLRRPKYRLALKKQQKTQAYHLQPSLFTFL